MQQREQQQNLFIQLQESQDQQDSSINKPVNVPDEEVKPDEDIQQSPVPRPNTDKMPKPEPPKPPTIDTTNDSQIKSKVREFVSFYAENNNLDLTEDKMRELVEQFNQSKNLLGRN